MIPATKTYSLLIDDGRSDHLPYVEIEAADDAQAEDLARTLLSCRPAARHIIVMRRAMQIAIVSRRH